MSKTASVRKIDIGACTFPTTYSVLDFVVVHHVVKEHVLLVQSLCQVHGFFPIDGTVVFHQQINQLLAFSESESDHFQR